MALVVCLFHYIELEKALALVVVCYLGLIKGTRRSVLESERERESVCERLKLKTQMQEIKKKIGNEYSDSKKKERHIVTWTQQVLFISLILLHSPFHFLIGSDWFSDTMGLLTCRRMIHCETKLAFTERRSKS